MSIDHAILAGTSTGNKLKPGEAITVPTYPRLTSSESAKRRRIRDYLIFDWS